MIGLCYIMSGIYSFLNGCFYMPPFMIFLMCTLFAGLLIANFHYGKKMCETVVCNDNNTECNNLILDYDYNLKKDNGPHKWKHLFPAANGNCQSPINIRSDETAILEISEPLIWNYYDELPSRVVIGNSGYVVELKSEYNGNRPTLSGADLIACYSFVSLCFRWSLLGDEGSEHSVNDKKYPLELQATHVLIQNSVTTNNCLGDLGILIVSYFFMITKFDNPYLDPIILNLHAIREPHKCVDIPPFPLSWLCYPFRSGFYSYGGSLTEPPCTEGVTWFIQPEPMAISERQLAEFRLLLSRSGSKILKNARPVQNLNSRVICYNRYDQYNESTEAIGYAQ